MFKQHVVQTIERWLAINDQEEFTRRVFVTTREIFTIINNSRAPVTLAKEEFNGAQIEHHSKPPRFDQLILKHKGKRPVQRRNLEQTSQS